MRAPRRDVGLCVARGDARRAAGAAAQVDRHASARLVAGVIALGGGLVLRRGPALEGGIGVLRRRLALERPRTWRELFRFRQRERLHDAVAVAAAVALGGGELAVLAGL